jgi:hypothetical protein
VVRTVTWSVLLCSFHDFSFLLVVVVLLLLSFLTSVTMLSLSCCLFVVPAVRYHVSYVQPLFVVVDDVLR